MMKTPLRTLYESLLQSQWWGRDELVRLQRKHLTSLLSHARSTSPFYRYRLNTLFRTTGTIDWDRWTHLPIVTREDLAGNFHHVLSRAPVAAHGPFSDLQSSGSTGDPVTVRTTRWMIDMVAACNWRAQQWHGIDWSGTLLNKLYVDTPDLKTGDSGGAWGPPWDRAAARGKSVVLLKNTSYEDAYSAICLAKPDYASAGSHWVTEMVTLNQRTDHRSHLSSFLVRGGAVDEAARAAARESFGAGILELYSSKEAGPIAHPCPDDPRWFHINDESVLVEVVDKAGFPCAPGTLGRVVVTPFASTALPLIRYDQGDMAIAAKACSCGRGLQTISQIVGRVVDLFRHPDGRAVAAGLRMAALRPLIGARRWQIAQVGPTSYEVRLPPGVAYSESGFDAFREQAKAILFGDAGVSIVRDCDLSVGPSGKFQEYVNEPLASRLRRRRRQPQVRPVVSLNHRHSQVKSCTTQSEGSKYNFI